MSRGRLVLGMLSTGAYSLQTSPQQVPRKPWQATSPSLGGLGSLNPSESSRRGKSWLLFIDRNVGKSQQPGVPPLGPSPHNHPGDGTGNATFLEERDFKDITSLSIVL